MTDDKIHCPGCNGTGQRALHLKAGPPPAWVLCRSCVGTGWVDPWLIAAAQRVVDAGAHLSRTVRVHADALADLRTARTELRQMVDAETPADQARIRVLIADAEATVRNTSVDGPVRQFG